MVFIKGYKPSKKQIERAKIARKEKCGNGFCVVCGKEYEKYSKTQVTCGSKICDRMWRKMKYEKIKEDDPIMGKAITISGTIRLKNKKSIMREMITNALGKPCKYCGTIITLDNCSLDHKIPRLHSKVFNRGRGKMTYTYEEIRELDKKENLQIICKDCNRLKSDFNDKQFGILLKFMKDNPTIGKMLKNRLNRGVLAYKSFGR